MIPRRTGLLLALTVSLAATSIAAGRPAPDVTSAWALITPTCGSGQVLKGHACWDQMATDASKWTVSDSSATWDESASGYEAFFNYTMPTEIAGSGGAAHLSVESRDTTNGSGLSQRICIFEADSDFTIKQGGDQCATAYAPGPGTSKYASVDLTLEANEAPVGTLQQVSISLGDGGNLYYTYKATGATPPPTTASATISGISGKVEVQRNQAAWEPADPSLQLRPGDKIHTGYRGSVVLTMPDGSKLTIAPMSLVLIKDLTESGRTFKTSVWLRLGEVSADVNRKAVAASDFIVRSPTLTTSSRGTRFTVLYDGSGTVVSTLKDSVGVRLNSGGRTVVVSAGHAVAASARSIGRVTALGRAGVPAGSVDPSRALALVSRSIAEGLSACGATPYSITAKPRAHGWAVSVLIIGPQGGVAAFRITGTSVRPANSLARAIASGCRHGPGAGPPNLSGDWVNQAAPSSPAWHLVTSSRLQVLDGTWTGGAGHSTLRGTVHATLGTLAQSYVYAGTFNVTEGAVHVTGTITVTIKSRNRIVIALTPNGGSRQSYTFTRAG